MHGVQPTFEHSSVPLALDICSLPVVVEGLPIFRFPPDRYVVSIKHCSPMLSPKVYSASCENFTVHF